ncbi:MAG: S8 family serine peptidase [Betaproteobacteria bacterium]|nr:S8 family serine peptidase [Betaproteobacteria bacterium]
MSGAALSQRVRVGIIDSGLAQAESSRLPILEALRFAAADDGSVIRMAAVDDELGHGSQITQILLENNPCIDLLIAQVFADRRQCDPTQVAAALDWLVAAGAMVINMSFGIPRPDAILRQICERANEAGVILVSSAPARGATVFPAAYPCCIAVSGDARCSREQISWLGTATVDFGAHPSDLSGSGGASYAAARISSRVSRLLAMGVAAEEIRSSLQAQCSYHGPESKHSETARSAADYAVGMLRS